MPIHMARATLQQYRICEKVAVLQKKHPQQIKRRIRYINHLDKKLLRLIRQPNYEDILVLAADIQHCVRNHYYPNLPAEHELGGFSFCQTLEDTATLLEIGACNLMAAWQKPIRTDSPPFYCLLPAGLVAEKNEQLLAL